MKTISALPSPPVSRSKADNKSNQRDKSSSDIKIPSTVSATFATDQKTNPEHECVSYIHDSKPLALTSQRITKRKNVAIFLTILITLFSLFFSVVFFVLSAETDTSSTIAVGLDAFFAVMGAGFVLWRLRCPDNEHTTIVYREKAGSFFFGITFIASGIITFGISTYRLFLSVRPLRPKSVLITLAVAISIFGILTFALKKVARKLDSSILMALTIDTFFACLLLMGVFSTEVIYMQTIPKCWYLDDAVSIVISVFFVLFGISLISKMVKSTKKGRQSSEN